MPTYTHKSVKGENIRVFYISHYNATTSLPFAWEGKILKYTGQATKSRHGPNERPRPGIITVKLVLRMGLSSHNLIMQKTEKEHSQTGHTHALVCFSLLCLRFCRHRTIQGRCPCTRNNKIWRRWLRGKRPSFTPHNTWKRNEQLQPRWSR